MTQDEDPANTIAANNQALDGHDQDLNQSPSAPPAEPEPEGGPFERQREFLSERFAKMTSKDAPIPGVGSTAAFAEGAFQLDESTENFPIPPNFRRNLMEQYRSRQQSQFEGQEGDGAAAGGAGDDDLAAALGLGPLAAADPGVVGGAAPPELPAEPPANNWIPIGPSALRDGQGGNLPTTSGRTPGIAVAPGGTRVYAGTANGGVWVSEDTGQSWRSLMDGFDQNPTHIASDTLACGAIALVAGATAVQDTIYVGSGEGHGGVGAMFGIGPIVSTDGGQNWDTEPVSPGTFRLLAGSGFYAMAVDPNDTSRVVGATRVGLYRREPDGAGGFHWDPKSYPGDTGGRVTSVVAANDGGTTFYAANHGGNVFSSNDGDSWVQAGSGFPTGAGRITLAVQPNNASVVYAFVQDGRLFRLDTNDGAWRQVTGIPSSIPTGQGWYDLAIAIAPDNINRVYLGGSTKRSDASGNIVPSTSPGEYSGSVYRCEITVSPSGSVSGSGTYIGGSVHADIHALVFAPADANKLWVGCDGGLFYSTNPTGTGMIFTHKNAGLQTLSMNHLGQHPTEDGVLFCGSQDNGGQRFTGEEVWLHSLWGDSGYYVVNWNNPYKVLATYNRAQVNRTTDGGTRYSYTRVSVPLRNDEKVMFYAPLAGAPLSAAAADAGVVAFGSERLWLSTTFGGGWDSLPGDSWPGDRLVGPIRSITFFSAAKIYAGTLRGRASAADGSSQFYSTTAVYKFEKGPGGWTRTRIDTLGGANNLPINGSVTDIAIDYADASGDSIYISLGGNGDFRHVWHFDGSQWQQRSGPTAAHPNSLLDLQHNAIVTDPAPGKEQHLYVGGDIGIWRSLDGGQNWEPYSQGLPDAAVMDLKLHPRRLLRASTHGRGVYERRVDTETAAGIELFVRDTQLDQGRIPTVHGLADPARFGETVRHWRGPDIKLDTPDADGSYQFPLSGTIDFVQFVDILTDDARQVATHATAGISTKVYVQVHNRGVTPANGVQVMLLLANASAGLPALPLGYETDVQNGAGINTAGWQTVGVVTLDDIRVGFPRIASFELSSSMLPPPANLTGSDHHCVLALVHHPEDPYTSTETNTDTNSINERKAAHKNLKVVQFEGTLPSAPLVVPFRIHNTGRQARLLTNLLIRLNDYPGRVRLYVPPLEMDGQMADLVRSLALEDDFVDFKNWADEQLEMIRENQASEFPYHKEWSQQRRDDMRAVQASDFMLVANSSDRVEIKRVIVKPLQYHTIFLQFDRPQNGRVGDVHNIEITQWDAEREQLIGGLDTRVEIVPEPLLKKHYMRLWSSDWHGKDKLVRARLYNSDGDLISPDEQGSVDLSWRSIIGVSGELSSMRWHRSWKAYYTILRPRWPFTRLRVTAIGKVKGRRVAKEAIDL